MDEASLIQAARNGSQSAFAELYKTHLPYVKAVGRSILRTIDLDDLCQDTFMLAFTRIESFQGNSNFRTWLTRIAMNQCLMVLRRNKQATNGEANLMALDNDTASDDVLDQCVFVTEDRGLRALAAKLDLPKMFTILKPAQRRILEMAYLEDIPDQQIAEMLGTTLAAVKSKLHHAKRRVRDAYATR